MHPDLAASVPQFADANALPLLAATVSGLVFLIAAVAAKVAHTRNIVKRRALAFNPAHPAGSSGLRRRNDDVEAASELLFAVEKGLAAGGEVRLSRVRRDLIRAGYFSREAQIYYYVTRVVLACAGAYVLHALALAALPDPQPIATLASAAMGASLGLLAPMLYVRRRHGLLHEQCRNGFPTFLDLLVVCSEAGLAPRAGIERVSREITRTHPFLGANLFLMSLELRVGRPLVEAVEGLARRINLDEARSLGSLLHQTEELGGNLTNALRVFADEMRARRFLRAEEKAHSLPVKLVLPLALFVFPGMLVVTLLPVLIRVQRALF